MAQLTQPAAALLSISQVLSW